VGEPPDVIVAGINYGLNLGDDITYSGTVAAAFEGIVLGLPAIAVSQENASRGHETGAREGYDFAAGAAFVADLVREIAARGLPDRTILNVNVPHAPRGAVACRLGRRIYRDRLDVEETEGGRRRYRIYGEAPSHHQEEGTDFAAIADGRIAVTPIHLDLTSMDVLPVLRHWPLLGPA
jgi:5'-nucleotidase